MSSLNFIPRNPNSQSEVRSSLSPSLLRRDSQGVTLEEQTSSLFVRFLRDSLRVRASSPNATSSLPTGRRLGRKSGALSSLGLLLSTGRRPAGTLGLTIRVSGITLKYTSFRCLSFFVLHL